MSDEIVVVGPHRFQCANLSNIIDESLGASIPLLGGMKADLVITDPPWGQANLQYWATMRQEKVRQDWFAFLYKFVEVVTHNCNGSIIVKIGKNQTKELTYLMEFNKWPLRALVQLTYGRKHLPYNLAAFCQNSFALPSDLPQDGKLASIALASTIGKPGLIVFDPCVGLGRMAMAFAKKGCHIRGVEISTNRFNTCVVRFRKAFV